MTSYWMIMTFGKDKVATESALVKSLCGLAATGTCGSMINRQHEGWVGSVCSGHSRQSLKARWANSYSTEAQFL